MSPLFTTINGYIALAAVVINLVFAVIVIARTSRNRIFLTFSFICISVGLWNFGDYMVFATGNQLWTPAELGGSTWKYLSSIGSAMAPAFMFHFINALLSVDKINKKWIFVAYVFSGVLAISVPFEQVNSLTRRLIGGMTWNIGFLVLLFPFILWGILMVVRGIQRSEYDDEKNRLKYLLFASVIAFFAGMTDLVQKVSVHVPPLGHAGSVMFTSILAIGVYRHRRAFDVLSQTRRRLDLLREMAAGIAHEIRNPLSSIKSASILQASALKDIEQPKIREYHRVINEEVERLNTILGNFQDFTRPLKVEKDSINVNEVIQKTIGLVEMEKLHMKIKSSLSENVPDIQADPSLLKQVFINLIKNSFESCGASGELGISTKLDSPWVKISFLDDGPGIPAEIADRIFEPFFTTKPAGMGLGLAISNNIVKAHNGRIEARNRSSGGTEITIFLPVK